MATMKQLEDAKADLAQWQECWNSYSGNNPNKFQSNINEARSRVRSLTAELKAAGLIERTDAEKLAAALSSAFPKAQSKEVVTFEGKRYRLRFYPVERSRSGIVMEWGRSWEMLAD